MKFYKHTFDRVEDYLHHRPPYLMVDKIVSVEESQIVTEKQVGDQDQFLAGHFPGAPIMPGAMMQEMCTQSAGILIASHYNPMEQYDTHDPFFNEYALGVLIRVKNAKYRSFARPGDLLVATVRLASHIDTVFQFTSKVTCGERIITENEFQLTNIQSSLLQGVSKSI